MTKKKSSDVAFKPLISNIPDNKVVEKQNDIPPYDDSGISFKGYSKNLVSQNTYLLKKQYRFFSYSNVDDTPVSEWLDIRGKKMYITSLFYSYNVNINVNNYFYVDIGKYDGTILAVPQILMYIPFATDSGTINFNPPIEIDIPVAERGRVSAVAFIGGTIVFNVCGFLEDR